MYELGLGLREAAPPSENSWVGLALGYSTFQVQDVDGELSGDFSMEPRAEQILLRVGIDPGDGVFQEVVECLTR